MENFEQEVMDLCRKYSEKANPENFIESLTVLTEAYRNQCDLSLTYRTHAAVEFRIPIHITNDAGEVISIYGLLYNQEERHNDDLWSWELNRYICYLLAAERAQSNKCKLAPELLIAENGNMIPLTVEHKNLMYKIMKEDIIRYRIYEAIEPFEVTEDDADGIFIIANDLMLRI